MIDYEVLFRISYGLYIVCSGDKSRGNGYICNTVFQITSDPPKFTVVCNKNNYTAEFIRNSGVFSVSVLNENAAPELFGRFGFRSGREMDKLEGMNVVYGETGAPIVMNDALAFLEFRLNQTVDAGTHFLFIADLVRAEMMDATMEPLTYLAYHQVRKGFAPKNAPTYIEPGKFRGGGG